MEPAAGQALLFGRPAREVAADAPNSIGYMPQRFGLYEDLSVMANLRLHARLRGLEGEARDALFDRLLAFTSLGPFTRRLAGRLSGGMKQRLLLASALLGDPKLLILDEPTAGLDPKERVRLRELLADMAKDRIILVATHVVSDVETVATKVILLRAGKIVDAAPVPELIKKYAPGQGLEDVYLNVFGEGDGK